MNSKEEQPYWEIHQIPKEEEGKHISSVLCECEPSTYVTGSYMIFIHKMIDITSALDGYIKL